MALFGAFPALSFPYLPHIAPRLLAIDDIPCLPPAPSPRPSLASLAHTRAAGTSHRCPVWDPSGPLARCAHRYSLADSRHGILWGRHSPMPSSASPFALGVRFVITHIPPHPPFARCALRAIIHRSDALLLPLASFPVAVCRPWRCSPPSERDVAPYLARQNSSATPALLAFAQRRRPADDELRAPLQARPRPRSPRITASAPPPRRGSRSASRLADSAGQRLVRRYRGNDGPDCWSCQLLTSSDGQQVTHKQELDLADPTPLYGVAAGKRITALLRV
ncbi:hypothetical protein B0H17DRAFT_1330027 [Mycena rosella]|uniref:Uncharacterized protein n=1 Tax=Mycena rosella TaxID=1033263 RepID=A0AAD7DM08_MYCRO|nr:hypothetical protein B0H17DRAFT_1330027 [Mycena rosella]